MDEEALFQEYSTNRALQAVYPDFSSYKQFILSQMPAQANEGGISQVLNNAASSMGSIKDLGKNLIMNKISSKMGLGLVNPLSIGSMMLGGLKNINDRIQSTDFARSKNLMDYLDAKSYGGIDARNAAAVANMAQARGIQKQMAQRPSSNVSAQDAARGNIGSGSANTGGSKSRTGGMSSADRGAALHG